MKICKLHTRNTDFPFSTLVQLPGRGWRYICEANDRQLRELAACTALRWNLREAAVCMIERREWQAHRHDFMDVLRNLHTTGIRPGDQDRLEAKCAAAGLTCIFGHECVFIGEELPNGFDPMVTWWPDSGMTVLGPPWDSPQRLGLACLAEVLHHTLEHRSRITRRLECLRDEIESCFTLPPRPEKSPMLAERIPAINDGRL